MLEKEHSEVSQVKMCNQKRLKMSEKEQLEFEHNLNLKFMQHQTKKLILL